MAGWGAGGGGGIEFSVTASAWLGRFRGGRDRLMVPGDRLMASRHCPAFQDGAGTGCVGCAASSARDLAGFCPVGQAALAMHIDITVSRRPWLSSRLAAPVWRRLDPRACQSGWATKVLACGLLVRQSHFSVGLSRVCLTKPR